MSILDLGSLQLTLFAMMLIGALLKKKGILDESGKKCLSDLCISIVIPCNIFKSCLIDFNASILRSCAALLVSAVIMQFPHSEIVSGTQRSAAALPCARV